MSRPSPRVVMILSTSPSYVGESIPPSSEETTAAARAWRGRTPFALAVRREEGAVEFEERVCVPVPEPEGVVMCTEMADAPSSVSGSLSSSEAS